MISEPLRIRAWGPWACFTRPEFHVERVSYPVITPSAARGVLEAILMKPIEKPEPNKRDRKIGFRWHVLRLGIVREGSLFSILRNELGYEKHAYGGYEILEKRTQRHSLVLKDVEYLIEAVIEVPECVRRLSGEFLIAKYQKMFERRARDGQCYHRPYLGSREFPCNFELAPDAEPSRDVLQKNYGIMFWDFDFDPLWNAWPAGANRPTAYDSETPKAALVPQTFHAVAEMGWITVARIAGAARGGRRVVHDR